LRNLPTSSLRRLPSRDSDGAAERTCGEAEPVPGRWQIGVHLLREALKCDANAYSAPPGNTASLFYIAIEEIEPIR